MNRKKKITASIIIPCWNEVDFIDDCLESIFQQDIESEFPIEVIVVDGGSDDGTLEKLEIWKQKESRIKVLSNPERIVPAALNIGIKQSEGSIIIRMDAHALYSDNYIRNCIKLINQKKADNVGGVILTRARGNTFPALLVQALSTHRFGVGDAQFRLESNAGWADTVPYGCYRRETFDYLGWFDERLVRNQDYEFNQRVLAVGGKIWLDPKLEVYYYNQPNVKGLLRQAAFTGQWNAWMWWLAPYSFRTRHTIPFLFVMFLFFGLIASILFKPIGFIFSITMLIYLFLAVFSSLQQAVRYTKSSLFFALPFAFFFYHIAYGLGTAVGFFRLLVSMTPIGAETRPWDGYPTYRINLKNL